jgi:signal recognition particle subunit SEC65
MTQKNTLYRGHAMLSAICELSIPTRHQQRWRHPRQWWSPQRAVKLRTLLPFLDESDVMSCAAVAKFVQQLI